MLITKEVEIKINSRNFKYYESLGYEIPKKRTNERQFKRYKKDYMYDFGNTMVVDINDLQKGSRAKVDCLCDYCLKEIITMPYERYTRLTKESEKIACKKCSPQKAKETSLIRYGVDSYTKTEECKEKTKQTCLKLYGVEYTGQLEETKNKRMNTNFEKYGVKYATQNEKVKEKTRNTNIAKYGVLYSVQSSIVKEKICKTMHKNGTQKTSKQQLYLHNLYGGELNYPIKYYDTDICLLEEKLALEYDGSGHDLRVVLGRLTQEEFDKKEIARFNVIKREGYKQMRIISLKDLLPTDDILLQMLSIAKEYFNTTSHTWVNFDIDNSKMINAENKDIGGVFFDYGELRKIKEAS